MAIAGVSAVALGGLLWLNDRRMSEQATSAIYTEVSSVPSRAAALVLGTGKWIGDEPNLFYNYRLEAAAELFKRGKVRALVVSGDNSREDYDEPRAMKADLVAMGIPAEFITTDHAGFRTLDSVIRAKEVFGLDEYVIVSQRFHCERALYIARQAGHSAIAYAARDVDTVGGVKVRIREVLARCRALLDTSVLGTGPKFLGGPEEVRYRDA